MTAVSSALRSRYRLGQVPQLATGNFRTLSDAVDVTENTIPIYVRIVSGDRITSVLDSSDFNYIQGPGIFDSFGVSDLLIPVKSTSPVLLDIVDPTWFAAIKYEASPIRYRNNAYSESISLLDSYQKTISRNTFVIVSKELSDNISLFTDNIIGDAFGIRARTLADSLSVFDIGQKKPIRAITRFDDIKLVDDIDVVITRYISTTTTIFDRIQFNGIDVTDTIQSTFLGINQRTLSETVSVDDFDILANYLMRDDTLGITDSDIELRFVNRINAESAVVSDDIIVTRSAIFNESTISDSITTFDQALPTYVQHIQISADIIIAIETH